VRILLDYRPALRQRTGVGAYVHETVRALLETTPPGESVVLFSSSWKDRLATEPALHGAAIVDRRIPVRLLNLAWHRLGWPAVEQLAGTTFDVVQGAHPLLIPTRHAARLVTIYDLDYLDHPERTRAEIRRDYPALTAEHARRADQVVVISAHTAREVESRLGVPASHISICVPGVSAGAAREAEPDRGGCILFIGTLEPRKNLRVLLDAYGRLVGRRPDTPRLVLAGRITPEAQTDLQHARSSELAGRVDIPGYVDDATKQDLFRRALVFVLPSHTEGFGLPAVEAMAAGVPVIVANRGALPEVVGPAGRLIDPDDPEGLATTLQELLDNRDLRRGLSHAGRARARQFTWAATARAMRDAWRQALVHRQNRLAGRSTSSHG
jgi:glycosyltransferase involved in cell wall biosynthesis